MRPSHLVGRRSSRLLLHVKGFSELNGSSSNTVPLFCRERRCLWIGRRLSLHFSSFSSATALCRLHIQYKVDGCPKEVRSIGFGYERIDRVQSAVGQFQVIRQHDDGNRWAEPLDLTRNECAIQKSKGIFEHDCIHGLRRKKSQAFVAGGRGEQLVSVLLQQAQLSRVAVDTEQSVVGSHARSYRGRASHDAAQNCSQTA